MSYSDQTGIPARVSRLGGFRLGGTVRVKAILVMLAGGLALSGCGSDQATPPPPISTPSAISPAGTPPPTVSSTAVPAPPPGTTAPATRVPACAETTGWGTAPRGADAMSRDALYLVRPGRHACFDRVVFDVNGAAETGFAVRYVPVVNSDPKGDPLPVPGGAVLEVVVRAPALGTDDSGHQPGRVLAATGDYLVPAAQVRTWPSLRAVRFAGSFEGLSTFAVGVRANLPFRVFTQVGPRDRIRRVIVDIAH